MAYEAKALARQGFDQSLSVAAVADGTSGSVDASCQCRIRDDASIPNRSDEIVLAHDAFAVADQMQQQVEYLRLHRQQMVLMPQLASLGIERVILKEIEHFTGSQLRQGNVARQEKTKNKRIQCKSQGFPKQLPKHRIGRCGIPFGATSTPSRNQRSRICRPNALANCLGIWNRR